MGQLMKFTAVIIKEGPYHSPPPTHAHKLNNNNNNKYNHKNHNHKLFIQ